MTANAIDRSRPRIARANTGDTLRGDHERRRATWLGNARKGGAAVDAIAAFVVQPQNQAPLLVELGECFLSGIDRF